MKWLYLPFPRNTITQGFDKNANSLYKEGGLKGHTAIDWETACGTPLPNCATGLCYSIKNKDNFDLSRYRAAYFIVENADGVFEVSYGHLQDIYAEPGKTYGVGEIIGTTGNTGDVYRNGIKVTKYRPGCPGGHLHGPQVRVLKKTKTKSATKTYLTTANGVYKKEGYYYEVLAEKNGYAGCVNPESFFVETLAKDYKTTPMKLELNAEGPHVSRFQTILKTLGYFPQGQKITDFYGPVTAKAYEKFKADTGFFLSTVSPSTTAPGALPSGGMNDEHPKFAFLASPRFWAIVIGAAAGYARLKGWIGDAEITLIGTITAGFVTVRTVDRVADKKVEAAEISSGHGV
jgi:hypothetical protein